MLDRLSQACATDALHRSVLVLSATSDQHVEIFISPELGDAEQTSRIVGVAAHELVHSVVGPGVGHRKPFKLCAVAIIGLKGPMPATTESEEFIAWVNDVLVPQIGPYPAGKISGSAASKQHAPRKVRMLDLPISR